MTPLKARILDLIGTLGPIPVGEYMAICLSDPAHGYYMAREPFGRSGDFITAPEVSQMFGELVGAWFVAAWRAAGSPDDAVIAEIGPGRGTLMKDMTRAIVRLEPRLRDTARFVLVETSARLGQVQAATLEETAQRFQWTESLDAVPDGALFIVGNEFFDALPIRQYVKTASGWNERMVGIDGQGGLVFTAGAGSLDTALLPPSHETAPEGTVAELSPARAAAMQTIAERIARHGGAGLFFDYGHMRPGMGDTFQAVRRHRPENVFDNPGEADLTSHVDFAALATTARAQGLAAHLATQGDFLLGMGLLERAGRLGAQAGEAIRERLRGEVARLAAPEEMGELFKVLAVAPGGTVLPAFDMR